MACHTSREGCYARAGFHARNIFMTDAQGLTRNVYDVAREQIDAGLVFKGFVPKSLRADPELRSEGVRLLVCEQKLFYSRELDECFKAIERAVENDSNVKFFRQNKRLGFSDDGPRTLCREKETDGCRRIWEVIPRSSVVRPSGLARVTIAFQGKPEALEGYYTPSVPDVVKMCQETNSKSLLALPTSLDQDKDPSSIMRTVVVPKMEVLLDPLCESSYKVCVMCCRDGVWQSYRFFGDEAFSPTVGGQGEALCVVLKKEFARGFCFESDSKHGFFNEKGFDKTNMHVLMRHPELRDGCCSQANFFSEVLQSFVQNEVGVDIPEGKKLRWEVVSKDKMLTAMRMPKPADAVLLAVHGEAVALLGVYIAQNRIIGVAKNSLWEFIS